MSGAPQTNGKGAVPAKVVLAAGGTGGHMFPASALAREMLARGSQVVLITDRRGGGFSGDLSQVETHRIAAGALAGGGLPGKLRGLGNLVIGYFQARGLLRRLAPDIVVGFGGYPSVPTALAAAHRGVKVVLHEQNAVLGRANRLLAPRAQAIGVCFREVRCIKQADLGKLTLTGNPVRAEIAALAGRGYPEPQADGPLQLLVIGGSQGAQAFNTLVPAAVARLPEALRRRLKINQQVRGDVIESVAASYRDSGVEADLRNFFDDMPARLAAAHLMIGRAGASTIAELAAAGRPAILVPYPHATDDHQAVNARALTEIGGAWMMIESDLNAEDLAERLESLFSTPALLSRAARCAAGFGRIDAAARLADLVCGRPRANGDGPREQNERREAAA